MKLSPIVETFLSEFGDRYKEELFERIAVMHFDEELPLSMAEVSAVRLLKRKYGLIPQDELVDEAEHSTMGRQARRAIEHEHESMRNESHR